VKYLVNPQNAWCNNKDKIDSWLAY
jgi:hypothetical protein